MKTKVVLTVFTLALWLVSAVYADQAPAPQREELLFQEIPVVITAARHEQPFADSPSTISVITAEDIKLSGATNLEELFRSLPGMDVFIATASNTNVSARGQNFLMPHNILTMIDGYSVYEDFLGTTLWETLPVTLDEIKQIEIIKGPGSALYGANAFAGVINIITKSPDEIKKTTLSGAAGEQGTRLASFLTARNEAKWGYKFSLGYDGANAWSNPAQEAKGVVRTNFTWRSKLDEDREISFSSSLSQGKANLIVPQFLSTVLQTSDFDFNRKYFHFAYEGPGFSVRSFWNDTQADLDKFGATGQYNIAVDTYDTEVERFLQLGENNSLILGGNIRLDRVNSDALDANHAQTLWGTYLQDEIKIKEGLTFTLGGRYDYHPLAKEHFSPRASLVFHPRPDQTMRLSAATAFRNPSFSESYLNLPLPSLGPGYYLYGNPS
ncbi:MAG TPA: TonB-dependent receptor, partial [Candidatus Sulfotelmatobacter sp.]|nr:TonB-dependent receptor [Candidatus Sulfotelmatobacter sp.]